ncbi:hypothetical protein TNCV_762411 [Trichonephila clavipes]|nr:hypothetical protein TNCV_762411 [Trichonephila clavipes]
MCRKRDCRCSRFSASEFSLATKRTHLVEWLGQQTKLPHLSEASVQVYVETPLHLEKLTVCSALWAGNHWSVLLQRR